MTKIHNRSLEELHRMLVSKEITVQDLTKATFERIKETEPEIEAFITLNEEKALEQAKALDEKVLMKATSLLEFRLGSRIIS